MQELIKDKLYSFDEKVRVEIGPQIVELECNDENLSDKVTHPNYQIGVRDAFGRVIRYDELPEKEKMRTDKRMGVIKKGEMMACVDWKAKHAPHLWKIYEYQKTEDTRKKLDMKGKAELDEDGSVVYEYIYRFIKVKELEGKTEALAFAENLLKEIK